MDHKNMIQSETSKSHYRRINQQMIIGWSIIVVALLATYTIEVFKKELNWTYLLPLALVAVLPLLLSIFIYFKKPDWERLCYFIVPGYFVMYIFVMFTGSTRMVFSYILPMLSLLTLYHHPKLILCTGIAALCANLLDIYIDVLNENLNAANSKDAEIQIALIVFCFSGCYLAARLYDRITKQNYDYVNTLDEKNSQIQSISLSTLTTIAKMIDAKDSYTEGHSQRVSVYSAQIAEGIGLSKEEVENVRKVALLHDIGKVGIPDLILNKPARLTDEEYLTMKNHAAMGADIIKAVQTIPGIYEGVRFHHERYDGKGYPDGLKGEEIPFIARIIAVADAFDAMTSNRVYRRHLDDEHVLSELEHGLGTQFDPMIARTTIEMLKAGTFKNISPDNAQPPVRNNSTAAEDSEKVS